MALVHLKSFRAKQRGGFRFWRFTLGSLYREVPYRPDVPKHITFEIAHMKTAQPVRSKEPHTNERVYAVSRFI